MQDFLARRDRTTSSGEGAYPPPTHRAWKGTTVRTDSAPEGLLYDIKRWGKVVSAGLVRHYKELPRPRSRTPSAGIYEENPPHEDPYCDGPTRPRGGANISLQSDDLPDETPYDPSWLRDVIVFIDKTEAGDDDTR